MLKPISAAAPSVAGRSFSAMPLVIASAPAAVRGLLDQEGVPWREHSREPLAGRFVIFDSVCATPPEMAPGQTGIDLCDVLDAALRRRCEALLGERSARAAWQIGSLTPYEDVAARNRRLVRHDVIARLREAVSARGGVWINLAPAPAGYRTFFSLRFDHDRFDRGDFHATLDAIAGYEEATSHFLSGAAHAGLRQELDRLRGHDVGSHGYWHHSYRDPELAQNNIGRGIVTLLDLGFEPQGYVAPHGRFDRRLLAPLAAMGVTHCSEFGLAFDDWPFFPDAGDVLQIPVHPVCLGICLAAASQQGLPAPAAAEVVAEHFCRIAEAKRAAGEPMVFYGHPDGRLGKFPQVIVRLLETVRGMGDVWPASFSQLNRWWRGRANVRLTATLEGDRLKLEAAPPASQWPIAIDIWRGNAAARHVVHPGRQTIDVDCLSFETRAPLPRLQRATAPRLTFKERLLRVIDWERETPLAETSGRGWRGRIKRALRRIKPAWHEAGS